MPAINPQPRYSASPAALRRPTASARGGSRGSSLGVAAVVLGIVLSVPLWVVITSWLNGTSEIWRHLAETVLTDYIWNSIALGLGVAIGVSVIGVMLAWVIVHYRFPAHRVLQWALILPLAMPAYVIAFGYADWLEFAGPVQTQLRVVMGWRAGDYWFPDIRSLGGAIVLFTFVLYPYVYLLARSAFIEQSASTLEAARLAGMGAWARLLRVSVPLARPAIAGGAALALMETLADFGTVSYFGVTTFTTGIFHAWQSFGDRDAATQLAAVLLALVAIVLLFERWTRGDARYQSTGVGRPNQPVTLRGWRGIVAMTLCALPVMIGFLLPAALLVRLALIEEAAALGARELRLIGSTAMLATIAAIVVVAIALLLAYALRQSQSWRERAGMRALVRVAVRGASLGYAVPGAVIAVGVLAPLGRLDNLMIESMRSWAGITIGLVFTGSIVALIYAYAVRFTAIALQSIEAGLARITPSMDDAARSLGLSRWQTLYRVHLPMLRGSALVAMLLVFIDVMKELPATFALRPFNFDTLAVHIYNLTKDERLGEAAVASMALVAIGLIPLLLLGRRMLASRR